MSKADPSFTNPFPPASEADWLKRVETVLKGADFQKKLVARSHDGLAIQPLYARRADAPLVAGGNAGKPWHVVARVDHPDADTAAAQAREDLEGGADALALVFAGSRSARSYGLPCTTPADLDAALSGVHLDLIRLRLDPAPDGSAHALTMAALVEKRKLNPAQAVIDFGIDPVSGLTFGGQLAADWASIVAQLGKTVLALKARGFRGPFLTVDLRPYHEAGASEGQELAAALAQGVLYLRTLEASGMALADAFRAISFIVPVDGDQFMGVAKVRALRKLWMKVTEACGVTPEPVAIHAETSWRILTKRDPHVNILRATIAAFAAGVGGSDTVTVLPFTQALGLPEAQARRLARNTSIVLMEEAHLWRVIDPVAGAGGYEALTDAQAAKAWALFQQIEGQGGIVASLTAGHLQARIAETAKARDQAVAMRREPLTGTSEFANLGEMAPLVLDIAPLAHVPLQDSGIAPLVSRRISEPFEALRDRADAVLASTGARPKVRLMTLMTLGPLADHAARLAFVRNFFEAGGIELTVLPSSGAGAPPSPASGRRKGGHPSLLPLAGEGAERSEADEGRLTCLVGSDAAYAEGAGDVARDLTASGNTVWLAGRPGGMEAALNAAGVRRFIFAGCDVVEALTAALEGR
jgi:methylmalonyl-CoA mutase